MNERIKEFRFLAVEYTNEKKPLGITKWNEIRDMKFAELIVRECANFVDSHEQIDKYGEAQDTVYGKDLLEHFGVE
jgi:hypothetical protein